VKDKNSNKSLGSLPQMILRLCELNSSKARVSKWL
jgi:hypothetical protein